MIHETCKQNGYAVAFEIVQILPNKNLIEMSASYWRGTTMNLFLNRRHEKIVLNLTLVEHFLVEVIDVHEVTLKL